MLKLVPPIQPDPRQAAIERIKRMENPREVLQCPRCGCRSYVNIYNGATLQGSKMRHGTAIDKCLCENCYRQGIKQSLLPDKPRAEIDRSLWMGRAISEMSRGELLDVIGR